MVQFIVKHVYLLLFFYGFVCKLKVYSVFWTILSRGEVPWFMLNTIEYAALNTPSLIFDFFGDIM